MSDSTHTNDGARYRIRVEAQLDARWTGWFEGATVLDQADGTTILEADAVDQAALHGLLRRVRDAGLALVAVTRVDAGAE